MNGKYQVGSGRVVTVTHDTPFIKNSVSQPTLEVKQEISTVNSTQLVLENPDAYDEIQSRFNELLQQKGDLEKTLHAEAQKHREDLRMWEYEADCPGAAVEAE